jgi:hypothetical protein
MADVIARLGCGGQQKVSLFHTRQLRFSYRLPPSVESAHFEKIVKALSQGLPQTAPLGPLTSPHSVEALYIPGSILWILAASTDTGALELGNTLERAALGILDFAGRSDRFL